MEDNELFDIVEAFQRELSHQPSPVSDGAIPFKGHEVLLGSEWMPSSPETWRSWTGLRRLWGVEYHGDVYAYGSTGETPWRGLRHCYCETCQRHVESKFRPN